MIIPFAFLVVRPEGTKARLRMHRTGLMSRARQLMAAVDIFVGAYMMISA